MMCCYCSLQIWRSLNDKTSLATLQCLKHIPMNTAKPWLKFSQKFQSSQIPVTSKRSLAPVSFHWRIPCWNLYCSSDGVLPFLIALNEKMATLMMDPFFGDLKNFAKRKLEHLHFGRKKTTSKNSQFHGSHRKQTWKGWIHGDRRSPLLWVSWFIMAPIY